MNELIRYAGMGMVTGTRSMLGPALVARRRVPRWRRSAQPLRTAAGRILTSLTLAEMVADKSGRLPPRTRPLPLTGRALAGAGVGLALAPRKRRGTAALIGAVGAVAGAYAACRWRELATSRWGLSDAAAGLVEDVVTTSAGEALVR